MGEQKIILKNMPCSIKGFVIKNNDDSYTIFINARYNYEQQVAIYEHELNHIRSGDFDYEIREAKTVDEVENKIRGS